MTIQAKHRITIQRSALVVALLLMSVSLGATAAQAAQTMQCGTVLHDNGRVRYFGIKASGVSCATARKMTGLWNDKLSKLHRGCRLNPCHVRDFTCRAPHPQQFPDRLIDCRRPGARVTWRYGLPVGSCVYTHSCKASRPTGGEAFRV